MVGGVRVMVVQVDGADDGADGVKGGGGMKGWWTFV